MDQKVLLFCALLRAGLTNKPVENRLFLQISDTHWKELYQLSVQQALVGIIWDGILTLPKELQPNKTLWYKWFTSVLNIEKANKQINHLLSERISSGLKEYTSKPHNRIQVALLKGQGTAALYPDPLHRTPGDIDIFAGKEYHILEKILPTLGFKCIGHSTKHTKHQYEGIILENHRYVALLFCPWSAWRLNNLVKKWFPAELHSRRTGEQDLKIAPPWFEALFSVIHFREHLHLEGVGWRHLCDWAIIKKQALLSATDKTEPTRYQDGLRALNLVKMETVMQEIFDTLVLHTQNPETLSPMSRKVYEEMMRGGNFGHHAENAHAHLHATQKGFWPTLWNLATHDIKRSIRFFSLFPGEAICAPPFRIAGYIKRKGN